MKRKMTAKEVAVRSRQLERLAQENHALRAKRSVKRAPVRMAANSGVWLKANKREGQKREHGIYIGDSGKDCIMVLLDDQYRSGKSDDGLREVPMDQIEESTA